MLTNSFACVNLDKRNSVDMFNIGFKKDLIQRLKVRVVSKKRVEAGEQMNTQVKRVLEQKGLILMARG